MPTHQQDQEQQNSSLQSVNTQDSTANQQEGNKKKNNTGIPDKLKAVIEHFSGFSLDKVKVHYNSEKPAEMGAHAYTEGFDVYIAPGQEKHLAHELWHVVQQMKGEVKANTKVGGVKANKEKGLEREADVNRKEVEQKDRISGPSLQEGEISTPIIQQKKGDGKGGGKKKGDDYCNNLGKTIPSIFGSLPDFIDADIRAALEIINNNRARCSVPTELADQKGADENTAAYGELARSISEQVAQIEALLKESDVKYATRQVKAIYSLIRPLVDAIPETAIDPRVAEVIAEDAEQGSQEAIDAINAALIALKRALKKRLQSFMLSLLENIKNPKKDDKDPDKGGGGGMGLGQAIVVG